MVIFNADDPKVFQKNNKSWWRNSESQLLEAMKCAYLIVLMATYWMTEAMPLPITSMIPMVTIRILIECCILNQVGLPLLGLMSTGEVAVNYLNATNYMVSKSISFDQTLSNLAFSFLVAWSWQLRWSTAASTTGWRSRSSWWWGPARRGSCWASCLPQCSSRCGSLTRLPPPWCYPLWTLWPRP